jgi:hypothetical protein
MCREVPFLIRILIQPFLYLFFKSSFEGIQTSLYLSTSDEIKNVSGKYFDNSKSVNTNSHANNKKLIDELWEWSVKECEEYII